MDSDESIFYHNCFVTNFDQAYLIGYKAKSNIWHDPVSDEGNYCSDYSGPDRYDCPYQNETGYGWIGCSPFVLDQNDTDAT